MLSRRHFFFGSLAGPILGASSALAAKKPAERPSVLLITADRLPSWVLGAFGNKDVRTPNLDRLAQMGTRFERHNVCVPVPGPSLATILTGVAPMQLTGGETVPAGAATLDSLLGAAGYSCQATGPEAAIAFLDQQTAGKSFFLRVHFDSLRPPYEHVEQKYVDLYASATLDSFGRGTAAANAAMGREMLADRLANQRKAAAAITALDGQVQSVFSRVAARGLTDSTLVVFTSTCGALLGRHGLWAAGGASDPPNMHREAVETPLFWVWPGRIPAQASRPELVSAYDLLPSLCELLGIAAPAAKLCGRSYALLATGRPLPKKQPWRTTIFGRFRETGMAVIERYKLVARDQGKGPGELYDVKADPEESSNQYENPQFLTVKNRLAGELAGWDRHYSS
jgi:arylsulfatase A-like enzyme